jgi:hypothetical protein
MRKKENFVCVLIVLSAALIVCGAVMWGVMCHKPQTPQEESPASGTGQSTDLGEPSTPTEPDGSYGSPVPPITPVEKGTTNEEHNRGDVDVSDMTRNPDAEVVSSQIEYGTKEVGAYDE